ncbi:MFS transporter [Calditerricola satsumensis]|uniref:MFS transporter n=1 Tax=Calditerricola satsumensis TaxID=373054 RepID=UPI000B005F27|nr:MFS transporter [Calditerricola satsumensis]
MNAISRLERLPIGRVHYRYLYLLGLGWALDAMDVGLISFTLPAIKAAFNLSSAQMGLLGSAGLVGMFLGAAVGGRLADRYGRRAVVAYSLLVAGSAACSPPWRRPTGPCCSSASSRESVWERSCPWRPA